MRDGIPLVFARHAASERPRASIASLCAAGYLLSPISGIIIGMYTTDLLRIIQYKSFIFAAMAFLAQFLLLAIVKERPQKPMTPEECVPCMHASPHDLVSLHAFSCASYA